MWKLKIDWPQCNCYFRISIMSWIYTLHMCWRCQFSRASYMKIQGSMVWVNGKPTNVWLQSRIANPAQKWVWYLLICFFRYAPVLIAMYNVWDMVGRYTPLINFLKIESRHGLMIAVVSRFLFIPTFYFTAKYGDQGWMIMLTSLLGLTNGHLTVCTMTTAPKGYKVRLHIHHIKCSYNYLTKSS